jgi:hypothetical protein
MGIFFVEERGTSWTVRICIRMIGLQKPKGAHVRTVPMSNFMNRIGTETDNVSRKTIIRNNFA